MTAVVTNERNSLTFGEDYSSRFSVTRPELSLSVPVDKWRVSVFWSPAYSVTDTFSPTAEFNLSGTIFAYDSTSPNPIAMAWSFRDSIKVRAESALGSLRPAIQWERFDTTLTASSLAGDAKTEATKRFTASLWSAGASCYVDYQGTCCRGTLLMGDKTRSAEIGAMALLSNGLSGTAGVNWSETKVDELVLRSRSVFLGLVVVW
jgi:hypothetical protein